MSTQDHPDTVVTAPTIKERKFTKPLKCDLTEKELASAGQDLAYEMGLLQGVESELEEIKADYKLKVKQHETKIESLAKRIGNRFEMRDVECLEVKNFADKKMITTRLDTNQIIDERSLRNDELQQPLPGMAEEVEKPATSDADGETESTEAVDDEDAGAEE